LGEGKLLAEVTPAPAWNRFARWSRLPALLALATLLLMLVVSAIAPVTSSEGVHTSLIGGKDEMQDKRERDVDLALYDRITERVRQGQNYYEAVAIEHRATRYPLRPGFAVRLPTLALISAYLPPPTDPSEGGKAQMVLANLLVIAALIVWWRRFGEEPGGAALRLPASVALLVGLQVATIGYFFVLHELWAGALLALSLGLHRPEKGKWLGAVIAAAMALSDS
jgi:hypothetical protein